MLFRSVREEVGGFPRLDYDVINVGLDRSTNVLSEHVVHAPLVCRTRIPQTEWHSNVTVHAKRCDERSRELVTTLLRRRSQSTVAGLRPTAGERRPGKSLPHSSIPCAHSLYVTPWNSSCHLIELDHRGSAGTPATDEITRLRTWTGRFRPPPPSSRTSL